MIKINPVITPVLAAGLVAATTTLLPSCVNNSKLDSFERQVAEMNSDSQKVTTENCQAVQFAKMAEENRIGYSKQTNKMPDGTVDYIRYTNDNTTVDIHYSVLDNNRICKAEVYNNGKTTCEEFDEDGNRISSRDFYNNIAKYFDPKTGNLKRVTRTEKDKHFMKAGGKDIYNVVQETIYYPDGKTIKLDTYTPDAKTFNQYEYYPNGKMKSSVEQKMHDTLVEKTFYGNGKLESKQTYKWDWNAKVVNKGNGDFEPEGDWRKQDSVHFEPNSLLSYFY